ncbi:hypothetical protein BSL78_16537 [Apostichopus japonicus]|uniref:Uncharacterized protein n=1 Tax=Stichopus japonicus TaxID=307972 RepID=A0A2G8KF28_STIJA|nr:hypothetical protein BSL78_16537 [Apostichopus japonicus]
MHSDKRAYNGACHHGEKTTAATNATLGYTWRKFLPMGTKPNIVIHVRTAGSGVPKQSPSVTKRSHAPARHDTVGQRYTILAACKESKHKVEFHLQNKEIKDTVNLEIEARYGLLRRNSLFQLSIQLQIENLRHSEQITSPFQLVLPESIIKSFDQLNQNLSVHLDLDQSTLLANIFQLSEVGITDIKKHETPGTLLLEKLTKNSLISPTSITKLENALTEQGNEKCAKLVREFRSNNHVVEATMCPE